MNKPSTTKVFDHRGHRPQRSSTTEVIDHKGLRPQRSSTTEITGVEIDIGLLSCNFLAA